MRVAISNSSLQSNLIFVVVSVALFLVVTPLGVFAMPASPTTPPFDATIVNVDKNLGHSFAPEIKATGSNVYVAWADNTPFYATSGSPDYGRCNPLNPHFNGMSDVYISRSNNNGQTYSTPLDLTNGGTAAFVCPIASQVIAPQIRIAISGNNVYVVWGEASFVQGDDIGAGFPATVFFSHSSDGGDTFSTPVDISPTPINHPLPKALSPEIAASGNNVYIVWESNAVGKDVLYEMSKDSGNTFNNGTPTDPGSPINLSNNGNSAVPKVGALGTSVYVVWQDDTITGSIFPSGIGLKKSINGGTSFMSEINLDHIGGGSDPQLAVDSFGNAVVVWQQESTDLTTSDGDIFLGGSGDGITSKPTLDLTSSHGSSQPAIGNAFDPQIAVSTPQGSSNSLWFVTWIDTSPGFESVFSSSINKPFHQITDSAVVPPSNPRISAIGDNFFVTWTDSINQQIEFSVGGAGTDGVIISETGPTPNNEGREQPAIATNGDDRVYVAYHDHTVQNIGEADVRGYSASSANTCTPPLSGDWIVASSCTMTASSTAPANVIIDNGVVLTIPNGDALTIHLTTNHLLVHSGGGVLIKSGGKIN